MQEKRGNNREKERKKRKGTGRDRIRPVKTLVTLYYLIWDLKVKRIEGR